MCFVTDGQTIAGIGQHLIHPDPSLGGHQIDLATRLHRVGHRLALAQVGGHDTGIRLNRQGIAVIRVATGEYLEVSLAGCLREGLAAPGGWQTGSIRNDPDLKDPGLRILQVLLAMSNPGTGGHHLHIAGFRAPTVTQAVLVGNGTLAHIGDDLHLPVRVRREARVWCDGVIVPYP